ncbi:hypothetical protein [Amycolatopsis vastitatis]|uniref:Uncharacterized protein n=1 Tax=Amycolatopsis vastitatis TaxID=1905142 RepID=A0A229TF38_9PSEU|nr:hypothetical protein [Amycolatopsis vastitatis]OXM69620.1 hypothetical protein CF165_08915 [Amycolatopsis vastitatis]
MQLAAEATPVGPPWLAATLAIFAALVTLLTALMPAAVEKIKQRAKPSADSPALPASGQRTDKALDMIEESLRDLRRQRDDSTREVARLQEVLASREAELRRRGWAD